MSAAVAEKKPKSPKPDQTDEKKDERVTFMAEPSWVREVEDAARAQHMTISAYIRWATLQQMRRDKRDDV